MFSDSVRITALVGRKNGKNGGPRPITRYLAAGLDKGAACQAAMLDEGLEAVAAAQAEGWSDPELGPVAGVQLSLVG